MLRFLLIDDAKCKRDLKAFIEKHKKSIKALILEEKVEKNLLNIGKVFDKLPPFGKKIVIETETGIEILKLNELMYCKRIQNKTKLVFENKEFIVAPNKFAHYEKHLSTFPFMRLHQSYLVNLNYIVKYTKGSGGQIELKNGNTLPVSARKKENLLKELEKI